MKSRRTILAKVCILFFALVFVALGCQSKEERVASLTAEAEKLEQGLAKAAAAQTLLDGIEVVDAEFDGRVDGREGTARFSLTVQNNTEHMINRIEFEADVRVPGSSEPLLQGKIDSGLPGSVKPGESLSFSMYPMTGSSWDQFDPPDGVVVRLTPIGLSSIGQRNLAEARSEERLSKAEARLASLRSDLAELVPASR